MIYPPLPTPEIIDGRRLYTAGQMREFFTLGYQSAATTGAKESADFKDGFARSAGKYSASIDDLMKSMGMK